MSKQQSILVSKFCSRASLVLACSVPAFFSCSGDGRGDTTAVVQAETGTMRLELTARGASGALYRLRNATFQLEQIDNGGPPPPFPQPEPGPNPGPIVSPPRPVPGPIFDNLIGVDRLIAPDFPGLPSEPRPSEPFEPSEPFPGTGGSPSVDGGTGGFAGTFGTAGSVSAGGSGVGGSGGFLTFLSTENDPLATTLETTLPGGLFLITLFDGWFLERVSGGEVTVVDAQLLSPSTLDFFISVNEETFVNYRFRTDGDIVEFGEGRLIVDIEVEEGPGGGGNDPRRGVMENGIDALPFSLEDTLSTALRNAGSSLDGLSAYHAIIESYATRADGLDPAAIHCDDEITNGQPSLNGFPHQCGRLEAQQFDNIGAWFPTAAVNRLDLAPADGENCGQQRIIFANTSPIGNGRMLMILESQVPNPNPECGVSACAPIAAFWTALGEVADPVERGIRLREAFLTGSPELLEAGFEPFMNAANLGPQGGQIRTNNFNDFIWTLREFQFADVNTPPRPAPVAESPNGALWNDLSGAPQGEACRESFLRGAELGLATDNMAAMSFPVDEACKDSESRNDFSQDYVGQLFSGSGAFADELAALGAPFGLSAEDLAARARFAGSCMGCHMEAGGSSLGNGVTAPFAGDFVQVNEFGLEDCGNGLCFSVSELLRNVFLPHRARVTQSLLDGPFCGELPPEIDPPQMGSNPPPAGSGGVGRPAPVPTDPTSAPVFIDPTTEEVRYTLGGQLVDPHGH